MLLKKKKAPLMLWCFGYLKAYLIKNTGLLQQGHNTRKLCNAAKAYDSDFGKYEKDCAFLNDFYIETRYLAEDPLVVSKEDVEECFKIADGVKELLIKSRLTGDNQ